MNTPLKFFIYTLEGMSNLKLKWKKKFNGITAQNKCGAKTENEDGTPVKIQNKGFIEI
jgi:hypothetical protein